MLDVEFDRVPPLLGVSGHWGAAEVEATRQFEELHQMIYRRGGIRPTNAAVEELSKIIFLRLWSIRDPAAEIRQDVPLLHMFDGDDSFSVEEVKSAFTAGLKAPSMRAVTPSGLDEPIWPLDEPFRLENEDVLQAAVKVISGLIQDGNPGVSDPFGTAFDALLSGKYDHAGGLGTYLTPSSVAQMMSEVAAILLARSGSPLTSMSLVGDPFCGTGRFLVALAELVRVQDACVVSPSASSIFGADISTSAVAKARMNMMLCGATLPYVWSVADSITDEDLSSLNGSVDLILTNPPFGDGKYDVRAGIDQAAEAIPSLARRARIDPAVAGMVKCLRLLKSGGLLGIVLPDGVIESRAFSDLVHGHQGSFGARVSVVANISLPTVTFSLSGTVAKTSAVFLQVDRRPRDVVLARVDHVGYLKQAGRATEDPAGNDLSKIPDLVNLALDAANGDALTVACDSPLVACVLAEATHSYDPSRIDSMALESRSAIANTGGIELGTIIAPRSKAPRGKVDMGIPFVSVLHVDDLGTVAWHESESYRPTTPGKIARKGDLLVSLLNPSKVRAAVVPDRYDKVQVSAEFGIFVCDEDPYGVLALLYSDDVRNQLRPLGRGTSSSRRRISEDDVLSLMVPSLSGRDLQRIAQSVAEAVESVASNRARIFDEFSSLRVHRPSS